jgi:hypothetical protein
MRRLIYAALVVLLVAAVAAWLITARRPAIDAELARLPGVTEVRASGSNWPRATVVHLLDYHLPPVGVGLHWHLSRFGFVPDLVEPVQKEHEGILRRLAANHGTLTVFIEGLTESEVVLVTEKARQLARVDAEDEVAARQRKQWKERLGKGAQM